MKNRPNQLISKILMISSLQFSLVHIGNGWVHFLGRKKQQSRKGVPSDTAARKTINLFEIR